MDADFCNVAFKYGVDVLDLNSLFPRPKAQAADELTADGLHPNDRGHALVSAEIVKVLEEIRKQADEESDDIKVCEEIAPPMTDNAYEDAARYTIRNLDPELKGF